MTFLKDFSMRFSILRPAYRISTAMLANMLGMKTNGNITMIEKGQCYVALDKLNKISEIFAIEISWLFRQSKVPYTENTMPRFEEIIRKFPISKNMRFIQYAPDYYQNYEDRIKFFSLQDRANIVFLMHYRNTLTALHPYLLNDNTKIKEQLNTAFSKIKEKLSSGTFAFRFRNVDLELEYIDQALNYILFNPERTIQDNENTVPSTTYIPPLYQVYDFQDGDELRNTWYKRPNDK